MSMRLLVLTGLTALAPAPPAPRGRDPGPAEPRIRTRIYTSPDDEPQEIRDRIRTIVQRRARLGVTVDMRASDNASIGATLQSVTPGGPASKAGIRSGD